MIAATLVGLAIAIAQGAGNGPPSGVRMGVSLDPAEARVGQPVALMVRVEVPREARVVFPVTVDSSPSIEPLDPVVVRDTVIGAARRYTASYRFLAWQPGRVPIAMAALSVESPNRAQSLTLGAPVLVVTSVLPADSTRWQPQAARDIIALPTPRWAWWWLLLGAAVIAVGGGWWLQRRTPTRVLRSVEPARAAAAAFAALDALALPAIGEPARHAIVAAATLRQYLAARDAAWHPGLTTSELRARLAAQSRLPSSAILAVLETVDGVQFAAASIDAAQAARVARQARAVIDEIERRDALSAAAS